MDTLLSAHLWNARIESCYYATAIYLENKSYITIDGLELVGSNHTDASSPNPLVMANVGIHGGSYITVKNCDIHAGAHQGVRLDATSHVIIDSNNIFYNNCGPLRATNNCTYISVINNKIYDNLSINTNEFPDDIGGVLFGSLNNFHDHLTITGNEIYNNGYAGVTNTDAWVYVGCSNNFTVTHNSIHNNVGAVPMAIWGESSHFAKNGIIAYNLIYNNKTPTKNGYATVLRGNMDNVLFANNTIANNTINSSAPALYIYGSGTGSAMTNIRVFNNILYENKNASYTTHEIELGVAAYHDTTGTKFDNNLFYRSTLTGTIATYHRVSYGLDQIQGSKPGTWQYDTSEAHDFDANSITVHPLFISTTSFQLQLSSPAVDTGKVLSLETDYEGNPVPHNTQTDIGAYECVSKNASLDAPKNIRVDSN